LKKEIRHIEEKSMIMQTKVDSLENQNFLKRYTIDSLNSKIDTLKLDLAEQIKRKNKVIETVKYIQPVNDTIKKFIELEAVNRAIIRDFERIVEVKDSIILEQKSIIINDSDIKRRLQLDIRQKDEQIEAYNKELKKAQNKKIFMGSTTTVAIGIILILILL
jgi:hypothetical protein